MSKVTHCQRCKNLLGSLVNKLGHAVDNRANAESARLMFNHLGKEHGKAGTEELEDMASLIQKLDEASFVTADQVGKLVNETVECLAKCSEEEA